MIEIERYRHQITYVFIIYMLLLIDLIVIKFTGDYKQVAERVKGIIEQKNDGNLNLVLVPFKTIASVIKLDIIGGSTTPRLYNLIANIVAFIPMGLLIPPLLKRASFFKTMGLSFMIIIFIELTQFITCLGVADVDDVIVNMFGCLIGYFFFWLLQIFYLSYNKKKDRSF